MLLRRYAPPPKKLGDEFGDNLAKSKKNEKKVHFIW